MLQFLVHRAVHRAVVRGVRRVWYTVDSVDSCWHSGQYPARSCSTRRFDAALGGRAGRSEFYWDSIKLLRIVDTIGLFWPIHRQEWHLENIIWGTPSDTPNQQFLWPPPPRAAWFPDSGEIPVRFRWHSGGFRDRNNPESWHFLWPPLWGNLKVRNRIYVVHRSWSRNQRESTRNHSGQGLLRAVQHGQYGTRAVARAVGVRHTPVVYGRCPAYPGGVREVSGNTQEGGGYPGYIP